MLIVILLLIAVALIVGCYFWLGTTYTTSGGTSFNPTLILGVVLAVLVGGFFLWKMMKGRK